MGGDIEKHQPGLIANMAAEWGIPEKDFKAVVKKAAFAAIAGEVSEAEGLGFLIVCHEYKLNPLLKEIFAFKSRAGNIIPIVPVDGWTKIANRNNFDGCEFIDEPDKDGGLRSVTCKIYVKGRSHPVSATEYMGECARNTEPWKQWPARMLRHKAFIQACRYAFSLGGIYDPDEAERIDEATSPERQIEMKTANAAEDLASELEAAMTRGGGKAGVAEGDKTPPPVPSDAPPAPVTDAKAFKIDGFTDARTRIGWRTLADELEFSADAADQKKGDKIRKALKG